jgi:hypothetical protein
VTTATATPALRQAEPTRAPHHPQPTTPVLKAAASTTAVLQVTRITLRSHPDSSRTVKATEATDRNNILPSHSMVSSTATARKLVSVDSQDMAVRLRHMVKDRRVDHLEVMGNKVIFATSLLLSLHSERADWS